MFGKQEKVQDVALNGQDKPELPCGKQNQYLGCIRPPPGDNPDMALARFLSKAQEARSPAASRMLTRPAQLVFALVAICTCVPATPAMYRWVDENGVTVYSQSPPPTGDVVKLKKQRPPNAEESAAAQKRLEQQSEKMSEIREERTNVADEQTSIENMERQRAENCEAARQNIETLQNLGRRMIRTPDGRVLRLSEDQVQTQIEKAQIQIDEFCN
jgi:hypothetical protein